MRPRRSTQEHPPDLPPLMPPSPLDTERPLDVPDEHRLQVALHRALRFHFQRVLTLEGVDFGSMPNEIPIIVLPFAQPRPLSFGWWAIGSVCDAHTGLTWRMPIHWEPATDRVGIGRIPPPSASFPDPEPRPITMDGNYHLHVAAGWRYWFEGREYTADEAQAILCQSGVRGHAGWTWERVVDETVRTSLAGRRLDVSQGSIRGSRDVT